MTYRMARGFNLSGCVLDWFTPPSVLSWRVSITLEAELLH